MKEKDALRPYFSLITTEITILSVLSSSHLRLPEASFCQQSDKPGSYGEMLRITSLSLDFFSEIYF